MATTNNCIKELPWQQTMCVLCGTNCGIEVKVQDLSLIHI